MPFKFRSAASAAACVAAVTVAGCGATTRISDSWTNPVSKNVGFAKVATVALEKDGVRRKVLEDTMAAELRKTGAMAIASYSLVLPDAMPDRDQVKATLTAAGVDSLVMMRLTGMNQPVTFVPGTLGYAPYYATPWGYYSHWSAAIFDPAHSDADRAARVETVVYSLTTDQMIWAGLSDTLNPDDDDALVRGVGGAATREMRRSGVLR